MNIVHKQFGEVWIEQRNDGSIWFAAKDICDVLEYGNSREAIKKHVPLQHSAVTKRDIRSENGVNQQREITIIDESGLYRLILRSQMPQAEPFMNWVTEEVIPSIRKTGKYETPQFKAATERKAIKKLLAETNKYLTWTDHKQIERKLGVTTGNVSSVLKGNRQDATIISECFDRAMKNKGLKKVFYSLEGAEKLLSILNDENLVNKVVRG